MFKKKSKGLQRATRAAIGVAVVGAIVIGVRKLLDIRKAAAVSPKPADDTAQD